MLVLSGLEMDPAVAEAKAGEALTSGAAAETFARMVHALGGPADIVEKPEAYLVPAPFIRPVLAPEAGYLASCDTRGVGLAVIELGGGRTRPDDAIDHRVGFDRLLPLGTKVEKGDEIGCVHAASEAEAARAVARLAGLYRIASDVRATSPDILTRISA
jgi:thymidine phosphorylase